jgi:hypothetical protein
MRGCGDHAYGLANDADPSLIRHPLVLKARTRRLPKIPATEMAFRRTVSQTKVFDLTFITRAGSAQSQGCDLLVCRLSAANLRTKVWY